MFPNTARSIRRLAQLPARARTLRRAQDRENDLANRPVHDLDPRGKLNQTLDTDLYTALPHLSLAPIVTAADLLAEVTRRIDDLHAAGSVDEGSYTVLDNFLQTHMNTMLTAAEEHTRSQLVFLNKAAIAEKRIAQETWDTLQAAQADLDDAETLRAAARTALTGSPARTRTTRNPTMPIPRTIPLPGTAQTHHTHTPPPPTPTHEQKTTPRQDSTPATHNAPHSTPHTSTATAPTTDRTGDQDTEPDAKKNAA